MYPLAKIRFMSKQINSFFFPPSNSGLPITLPYFLGTGKMFSEKTP